MDQYKQQNAHQRTHADKLKLVYTLDRFNLETQSYTNVYKTKPSKSKELFFSVRGYDIFLIDVLGGRNNVSDKLMDYTK